MMPCKPFPRFLSPHPFILATDDYPSRPPPSLVGCAPVSVNYCLKKYTPNDTTKAVTRGVGFGAYFCRVSQLCARVATSMRVGFAICTAAAFLLVGLCQTKTCFSPFLSGHRLTRAVDLTLMEEKWRYPLCPAAAHCPYSYLIKIRFVFCAYRGLLQWFYRLPFFPFWVIFAPFSCVAVFCFGSCANNTMNAHGGCLLLCKLF